MEEEHQEEFPTLGSEPTEEPTENISTNTSQKKKKKSKKGGKTVTVGNVTDTVKIDKYDKKKLNTVHPRPDIKENFEETFKPLYESEEDKKKLDYYFDSYSTYHIHEEMLQDEVRTRSYMNAITKNPDLFNGKIVLDVGCGTGVLSIFAAQAGAKHVYAVEMAKIHEKAREIINLNGYGDKITVLNGKIEEIDLPVDKVDIIISEWMGYFLLYEGMFDSCIYARDKWLADDGLMFPDRAILYLTGARDNGYFTNGYHYWNNVYGFKMNSMKHLQKLEPFVEVIPKNKIVTTDSVVFDVDLQTCTVKDLDFSSKYKIAALEDTFVNGLVAWFDCFFSFGERRVKLTTSPLMQPTHWKQTTLYLDEEVPLKKGEYLEGSLLVKKNQDNPRELDIKASYHLTKEEENIDIHGVQYYKFS